MKIGDTVFCINASCWSELITKTKAYTVQALKENEVRVRSDNGHLIWLPNYCFSDKEVPKLVSITVDDEIMDEFNDCVEVTMKFSNGSRRFTNFMTVNHLSNLMNEHRNYVTGTKLVLVKWLDEEMIEKAVSEMYRENELDEVSIPY